MVHVIRTRYGWAVTNHEEGLLAHFEGEHAADCAEKFAMSWFLGVREKQPDPLPLAIRRHLEGGAAGQGSQLGGISGSWR
jgi:hypothetical protein